MQSLRRFLILYLTIAPIYLVTISGRIGTADSESMYNVSRSIANEGSMSAEPCNPEPRSSHCVPGTDDRYYAGFGLLPSLVAVPVVAGAGWVGAATGVDIRVVAGLLLSILTALVGAVVPVLLAFWLTRARVGWHLAVTGAALFAFASPLWHHSTKGFYSEPFFILFLLGTLLVVASARSTAHAVTAGFCFGLAVACRSVGLIMLPVVLLYLLLSDRDERRRGRFLVQRLVGFSCGILPAAIAIAWTNHARFGSPLESGYHLAFPDASSLLSTPLLEGLREVLTNGEVGLLVFVPWLILVPLSLVPSYRKRPSETVVAASLIAINLLFFAKYDSWHGGWAMGPRLLLPALPGAVLLVMSLVETHGVARGSEYGGAHSANRLLRYAFFLLVGVSVLFQLALAPYPMARYYHLQNYYESTGLQPPSRGYIIAEAVLSAGELFGGRPKGEALILDTVERDQQYAATVLDAGNLLSPGDYLRRIPNSINLTAPDLLLWKASAFGVPLPFAMLLAAALISLSAVAAWLLVLDDRRSRVRTVAGSTALLEARVVERHR
jgi:hypothetical protein